MLESACICFCETILTDKILEESDQLVLRDIAAIGFRVKGEIGDRTIGIEVDIEPQLHTLDIKFSICCKILDIHQQFAPAFKGIVDVVVIHGEENFRMLLGQAEVIVLVFPNEEYLRKTWGLDMRLGVSAVQ